MKNDDIAKGWMEYHVSGEDDLFHFIEILIELVHADPERAWDIILMIGSINDYNEEWLSFIDSSLAAGVLEELLVTNGEKVVEVLTNDPGILNRRLQHQLSLVNLNRLGNSLRDSIVKLSVQETVKGSEPEHSPQNPS